MSGSSSTNALNICERVRRSCHWWITKGQQQCTDGPFVKICHDALEAVATKIQERQANQVVWDEEDWHYQPPTSWPDTIRNERIALYILALDAINFCFWPMPNFEYVDLACALTGMATADHEEQEAKIQQHGDLLVSPSFCLSATRLRDITVTEMETLFRTNRGKKCPPDVDKRCALWNELGTVLCEKYNGSAWSLVLAAQGSAVQLVQLLYDEFPGFRDVVQLPNNDMKNGNHNNDTATDNENGPFSTIYFLKRAQICVGDLQAALKIPSWKDMDQLTTFADYRLPQLLRHWNVLEYVNDDLQQAVDQQQELIQGSPQETSIRAATVVMVELLVQCLQEENKAETTTTTEKFTPWNSVQVDWYLWQVGERMDGAGELKPFHRVRTIYY